MKQKIKWLNEPEIHDYPAAESYLSLIYSWEVYKQYITQLKRSTIIYFKAKDIFRASQLSLLGNNNTHIKSNLKKIKNGEKLSPLLLVRDSKNGKVIIADGYHRLCAVYMKNEDENIPCKIA